MPGGVRPLTKRLPDGLSGIALGRGYRWVSPGSGCEQRALSHGHACSSRGGTKEIEHPRQLKAVKRTRAVAWPKRLRSGLSAPIRSSPVQALARSLRAPLPAPTVTARYSGDATSADTRSQPCYSGFADRLRRQCSVNSVAVGVPAARRPGTPATALTNSRAPTATATIEITGMAGGKWRRCPLRTRSIGPDPPRCLLVCRSSFEGRGLCRSRRAMRDSTL